MAAMTIDELSTLSHSDLKTAWQHLYKTAPPPRMSQNLMRRFVAYEMQCQAADNITPHTERQIMRRLKRAKTERTKRYKSGTRLVREWHGILHQVTVRDHGYMWNGKTYRSLSAIATEITGTRWSGPRFFNIRRGDT